MADRARNRTASGRSGGGGGGASSMPASPSKRPPEPSLPEWDTTAPVRPPSRTGANGGKPSRSRPVSRDRNGDGYTQAQASTKLPQLQSGTVSAPASKAASPERGGSRPVTRERGVPSTAAIYSGGAAGASRPVSRNREQGGFVIESLISNEHLKQRAREKVYDVNLVSTGMPTYEPLLDDFLQDYFNLPSIREHLQKLKIIDEDGYIVDEREFQYMQLAMDRAERNMQLEVEAQQRDLDREVEVVVRQASGTSPMPPQGPPRGRTADRATVIVDNYTRSLLPPVKSLPRRIVPTGMPTRYLGHDGAAARPASPPAIPEQQEKEAEDANYADDFDSGSSAQLAAAAQQQQQPAEPVHHEKPHSARPGSASRRVQPIEKPATPPVAAAEPAPVHEPVPREAFAAPPPAQPVPAPTADEIQRYREALEQATPALLDGNNAAQAHGAASELCRKIESSHPPAVLADCQPLRAVLAEAALLRARSAHLLHDAADRDAAADMVFKYATGLPHVQQDLVVFKYQVMMQLADPPVSRPEPTPALAPKHEEPAPRAAPVDPSTCDGYDKLTASERVLVNQIAALGGDVPAAITKILHTRSNEQLNRSKSSSKAALGSSSALHHSASKAKSIEALAEPAKAAPQESVAEQKQEPAAQKAETQPAPALAADAALQEQAVAVAKSEPALAERAASTNALATATEPSPVPAEQASAPADVPAPVAAEEPAAPVPAEAAQDQQPVAAVVEESTPQPVPVAQQATAPAEPKAEQEPQPAADFAVASALVAVAAAAVVTAAVVAADSQPHQPAPEHAPEAPIPTASEHIVEPAAAPADAAPAALEQAVAQEASAYDDDGFEASDAAAAEEEVDPCQLPLPASVAGSRALLAEPAPAPVPATQAPAPSEAAAATASTGSEAREAGGALYPSLIPLPPSVAGSMNLLNETAAQPAAAPAPVPTKPETLYDDEEFAADDDTFDPAMFPLPASVAASTTLLSTRAKSQSLGSVKPAVVDPESYYDDANEFADSSAASTGLRSSSVHGSRAGVGGSRTALASERSDSVDATMVPLPDSVAGSTVQLNDSRAAAPAAPRGPSRLRAAYVPEDDAASEHEAEPAAPADVDPATYPLPASVAGSMGSLAVLNYAPSAARAKTPEEYPLPPSAPTSRPTSGGNPRAAKPRQPGELAGHPTRPTGSGVLAHRALVGSTSRLPSNGSAAKLNGAGSSNYVAVSGSSNQLNNGHARGDGGLSSRSSSMPSVASKDGSSSAVPKVASLQDTSADAADPTKVPLPESRSASRLLL
ncbi:hypothetical protein H9P43_006233 [Blastocladiella emersonii ATCC 22665]|nr:hypothetical protein H9P43_006233 [Blastocladiella emersonii ATCC 22665]